MNDEFFEMKGFSYNIIHIQEEEIINMLGGGVYKSFIEKETFIDLYFKDLDKEDINYIVDFHNKIKHETFKIKLENNIYKCQFYDASTIQFVSNIVDNNFAKLKLLII